MFNKIFDSFDGRNAIFKLKNNLEECQELITDY